MAEETTKGKRLPIKRRIEILDYVREHPEEKLSGIAEKFGITKQRLNGLKRNELQYRECAEQGMNLGVTTLRPTKYCPLEKVLFRWVASLDQNSSLTGQMVKKKAAYFAQAARIRDFSVTDDWLSTFKERWGITFKNLRSEEPQEDRVESNNVLEQIVEEIEAYEPRNVFCCNETVLFWKSLPSRLAVGVDNPNLKCPEKRRISVLLCTNIDASIKEKPTIVWNFERPRAFKNLRVERYDAKLPCRYRWSKNSWMSGFLFAEWIQQFDSEQTEPVLLLVENSCLHKCNPEELQLKFVKIRYLPFRCKHNCHPIDIAIADLFKVTYHYNVLQTFLSTSSIDEALKNFSIADAILVVAQSWELVSSAKIVSSWRQSGLLGETGALPLDISEEVSGLQTLIGMIPEEVVPSFDRLSALDILDMERDIKFVEELKLELINDSLNPLNYFLQESNESCDIESCSDDEHIGVNNAQSQTQWSNPVILPQFECNREQSNTEQKIEDGMNWHTLVESQITWEEARKGLEDSIAYLESTEDNSMIQNAQTIRDVLHSLAQKMIQQ